MAEEEVGVDRHDDCQYHEHGDRRIEHLQEPSRLGTSFLYGCAESQSSRGLPRARAATRTTTTADLSTAYKANGIPTNVAEGKRSFICRVACLCRPGFTRMCHVAHVPSPSMSHHIPMTVQQENTSAWSSYAPFGCDDFGDKYRPGEGGRPPSPRPRSRGVSGERS